MLGGLHLLRWTRAPRVATRRRRVWPSGRGRDVRFPGQPARLRACGIGCDDARRPEGRHGGIMTTPVITAHVITAHVIGRALAPLLLVVGVCVAVAPPARRWRPGAAAPARAVATENRAPAGVLRDGTVRLQLVAQPARWHPEADDGPSV